MKKALLGVALAFSVSSAAYAEYNTTISVPVDHVEPVYVTQQVITGSTLVCKDYIVRGSDNRLIGTIIGGVIGNEIEKGSGAIIGGVLGHEIGKNGSTNDRIEKRCDTQPVFETQQRFMHYNVYYRINGNTHMVKMHNKPANGRLKVTLYPKLYVEGGFH